MQDSAEKAAAPGTAALWGLLFCGVFPMIGLFALGPAMPRVAAAFSGMPNAALLAQLMGGASGFSFALSSPLIGAAIERWGYRQIYILSLIGFAVLGTLPALFDNLWAILALRLVFGVTVAGAMTAGITGLGTLPEAIRPRMYGRNGTISSVGSILTFPLVGMLATISWHAPFLIHLVALLVVPLAMMLPRTVPAHRLARPPQGRGIGVSARIVALCAFIGFIMYVGPMFSPFYLQTIGVTDPRLAALPLSGMSVASLVMTSLYGRLHDRLGTISVFGLILALVGLGLFAAGLAPALPLFMLAMAVTSSGLALFTPNVSAHIAATSANPARGIGWAMSAMFAVQVAFPFVAQAISRAVGPAAVFKILGGLALCVAMGFVVRAGRAQSRRRAPARSE